MPIKRIRRYLEKQNIPYAVIPHEPAFTAQKTAAVAHVPGRELAKTVIVKIDGQLAMAVLPADLHLDLDHLREATPASTVELAAEWEFRDRFSDCEAGAMPPFGNLYGMRVYVADVLTGDEYICFNACNHRELIRMRYDDFEWCVGPHVMDIARQPHPHCHREPEERGRGDPARWIAASRCAPRNDSNKQSVVSSPLSVN